MPVPNVPPVPVGAVLMERFRVESVLGVGAMGVVVAAMDLTLQRLVAIKFPLTSGRIDPEVLARFHREGLAAAALASEHVARVLDVGQAPGIGPFIVMEYLEGASLNAMVRERGPLAPDVAADYARQVCEGLEEAHARGIVHRDLKPANLFVSLRPNGKHIVRILDFGISKLAQPQVGDELTRTSEVLGTPLYAAPEQLKSSRSVDARADLYSLGASLFFLLTGAHPFKALTPAELARKVFNDPPPRVTDVRPDVPSLLSAVVERCLQKDPADRYASAADVGRDLDRCLTREKPVVEALGRRRPRSSSALPIVGSALLLVAATFLFLRQRGTKLAAPAIAAAAPEAVTVSEPPVPTGAPPASASERTPDVRPHEAPSAIRAERPRPRPPLKPSSGIPDER